MIPEPLRTRLRALRERGRSVVLIDGGAGSGKTTLARQVVAEWPTAQLVSLDDCYPGWDGLAAGSAMVTTDLLRSVGPGYRRWDWQHGRPADRVALDAARPVVVEGCGAITPASRALADLAVWVELDAATRRSRAIARDGEGFAAHWDEWAAQEAVHWRAHHPHQLADLVVATRED